MSARAWYFTWIFPVIRPFVGTIIFDPVTLTLEFYPVFEYFTWIFPGIRPFCGYHYFLPCDLDLGVSPIFLKTLTTLITFEQWVLRLWYFTWVFLLIRPFCGFIIFMAQRSKIGGIFFLSCLSFCHSVLLSKTLTLLITFEQWVLDKTFLWVPLFLTLWPWP